jgi:hypothetical protein
MQSVDNLSKLPPDLLLSVGLKLSKEDISNLCSTSTALNRLCGNENFWKDKLAVDFPQYQPRRRLGGAITYRKYYDMLYRTRKLLEHDEIIFDKISGEFPEEGIGMALLYPVPPFDVANGLLQADVTIITVADDVLLVSLRNRSTIIGFIPNLGKRIRMIPVESFNNDPDLLSNIQSTIEQQREQKYSRNFLINSSDASLLLQEANEVGYVELDLSGGGDMSLSDMSLKNTDIFYDDGRQSFQGY